MPKVKLWHRLAQLTIVIVAMAAGIGIPGLFLWLWSLPP